MEIRTQEEYNAMTERELWDAMQTNNEFELRKIHKALKKYGDSVPLMYRYPYFPSYFGVSALIIALVVLVVKLLFF